MTALILTLAILGTYAGGAIFGWRVGYVSGYESSRRRWPSLRREWHSDAVGRGVFSALFWPLMLPALLVGIRLTPTPPSVAAERNEQLIREQADEIARLEREAGIR